MTSSPAGKEDDKAALNGRQLPIRNIMWWVAAFVVMSAAAIIWVPQWLINNWLADTKVDAATVRLSVSNAGQIVLFALGGIIALVGLSLSLSRHALELEEAVENRSKESRRVQELVEQRQSDAERELRARFSQAVALLSDPDRATTRQAGVYALGALADDWDNFGRPDERQVCIDVLCGYLRSAWDTSGEGAEDEKRIRSAAFDLIGTHLRPRSGAKNWNGAAFNLRGVTLGFEVNLRNIRLTSGVLDLRGAQFLGATGNFAGSTFAGGSLQLDNSRFNESQLRFEHCVFSGAEISFTASRFIDTQVWMTSIDLQAGSLSFSETELTSGHMRFGGAKFNEGYLALDSMSLKGGALSFSRAIFRDANVEFSDSQFLGTAVSFNHSKFLGSWLSFSRAKLISGEVNFDDASFVHGKLDFDKAVFQGGSLRIHRKIISSQPVEIKWQRSHEND
jgi:hypothetical protein